MQTGECEIEGSLNEMCTCVCVYRCVYYICYKHLMNGLCFWSDYKSIENQHKISTDDF